MTLSQFRASKPVSQFPCLTDGVQSNNLSPNFQERSGVRRRRDVIERKIAGEERVPELTCHCGAVHIAVDEAPETVTSCNCSICRRTGTLMAYYAPRQVRFTPSPPPTDTYVWGDKSIVFHRCKTCGCATHWSAVDPAYDRMGVNMRLADPETLAKARIRRFDGADTWTFLDE